MKFLIKIGSLVTLIFPVIIMASCGTNDFVYDERDNSNNASTLQDLENLIQNVFKGKLNSINIKVIKHDGQSKKFNINKDNIKNQEQIIKKFLGYGD